MLRCPGTATRDLHAVLESLSLGKPLELLERVVLDLADPLAGDAERASDLLERVGLRAREAEAGPALPAREGLRAGEAEAELDHPPLALGERHQRMLDVLAAERKRGG